MTEKNCGPKSQPRRKKIQGGLVGKEKGGRERKRERGREKKG